MPKVPFKPENSQGDDDYEIVSFEDFCDKSPGSKTDLLTLNDNINYRLCFEKSMTPRFTNDEGATSSGNTERQTETSLSGESNVAFKRRLSGTFAPFGRHGKTVKGALFGGVIPKPRREVEASSSEQHRYERFSASRNFFQRVWELPGLGSGMLAVLLLFALGVSVWWAVCGTVGGAWGDDHYRKLWERAHPENVKTSTPIPLEKILSEVRYHDHIKLNAKNKFNFTEAKKRTDLKKSYPDNEAMQQQCDSVKTNLKFDCYPGPGATYESCTARGCCWVKDTTQGVPFCFYPPQYHLYRFANATEHARGKTLFYSRTGASPYPGDFDTARVEFYYVSGDVLQIKITDADKKRFEVPIPDIPVVPGSLSDMKYYVELSAKSVGFTVTRTDAEKSLVISTMDVGALILSEQLLQISCVLPESSVFGFGEHRARLKRDMQWETYTMFNRDVPPTNNTNLYGTHPFYLAMDSNGQSHGMLLLNSNAMDVVMQPTPAITYRTTGGVLNFLLFLGPSPAAVVQQYTGMVGRPFMPPYWALGFHLCRFGYNDLNTTRNVWKSNRDAGIPFDVQWNDIDYMVTRNDFTYDKSRFDGLPQFVQELHKAGMHYMILIDPGVSASEKRGTYPPFDRGLEMDVFIKNSTNLPFIAKVWNPESTAFPDFTHPNATAYWLEMMMEFHKKVEYDGAWIDMNEPSNFLEGQLQRKCDAEHLPYKPYFIPEQGLNYKTLCMDARHHIGTHYDVHNLYALAEAIATNFALTEIRGKRPFIISRASFPGLGRYSGHWSGDISSTWEDLRMSIPSMLSFSLFGIPMMGADICGFNGNTTEELCRRWMQAGAFYPFSRNHNELDAVPQDPASLGPAVVNASRASLRLRYKLLPYYYTQFWRAHVYGDTVARPVFFEIPDNSTHSIDDQFLIGPYVMVAPILKPGSQYRPTLYPGKDAWYDLRSGRSFFSCKFVPICHVEEDQVVTVRGGGIVPLQEPPAVGPVTTANTRSQPLQLIVAPSYNSTAKGELYWDDGESLNSYEERKYSHIEFAFSKYEVSSKVDWWGYGVPPLNNITVLNTKHNVVRVVVNGADCEEPSCDYSYDAKFKVLQIHVTLSLDTPFKVSWVCQPPVIYLDVTDLMRRRRKENEKKKQEEETKKKEDETKEKEDEMKKNKDEKNDRNEEEMKKKKMRRTKNMRRIKEQMTRIKQVVRTVIAQSMIEILV